LVDTTPDYTRHHQPAFEACIGASLACFKPTLLTQDHDIIWPPLTSGMATMLRFSWAGHNAAPTIVDASRLPASNPIPSL
jgi:hypothetical protein